MTPITAPLANGRQQPERDPGTRSRLGGSMQVCPGLSGPKAENLKETSGTVDVVAGVECSD
jgi:hypothetical protein